MIVVDLNASTIERAQQLAAALRDLGDRETIPALRRALRTETKDARIRIRNRIRQALPKRGGLNKWVGRTPRLESKFMPKATSVKLTLARTDHDLAQMNRGGFVRHPLFANRKRWFVTRLPSGPHWWEKATDPELATLRERVAVAVDQTVSAAMTKYGG